MRFLKLLLFFIKLFTRKSYEPVDTPVVVIEPKPEPEKEFVIPHPEQPRQPGVNADDVDIQSLLSDWFVEYDVINKQFWQGVNIKLVEDLHALTGGVYVKVPAATWAEQMKMELDPEFANTGILAHELCHISYSLLTENHKAEFETEYSKALAENELLKYIVSVKPYMQTGGIVEKHADCYRYMGLKVPSNLEMYYPNLII